MSPNEKKGIQRQINEVFIALKHNSITNTAPEEATTSINQAQSENEIDNNELTNIVITSINQVQQENEIDNNEQTNIVITSINQVQQENEETTPAIDEVQQIQQTTDILKTPKLVREIKMRDKSGICPHTQHSFFCYCERPQLTPEYIRQNKKTSISNIRKKQVTTNSIDRILKTYNTTYGEMNTCLPNDFYTIALRTLVDIPAETPQIKPTRRRKHTAVEELEIAELTQAKFPLITELNDEVLQHCKDTIEDFDISLWFNDKDKVNNYETILNIQN